MWLYTFLFYIINVFKFLFYNFGFIYDIYLLVASGIKKSWKRGYYVATDNGDWKQDLLKVELLKIPDCKVAKTFKLLFQT